MPPRRASKTKKRAADKFAPWHWVAIGFGIPVIVGLLFYIFASLPISFRFWQSYEATPHAPKNTPASGARLLTTYEYQNVDGQLVPIEVTVPDPFHEI
ncbi:hypothetical protein AC578_2839 [Pseudocercospora eumusae]|uniref:Uncharacterized protein n=1 Tax=Pseudocercospora eumusae TaxID=321146 RepID=A0A139H446_9PEZI|nr:hypothetical protein AC578_2839 [Pseudocercospora eumusae]